MNIFDLLKPQTLGESIAEESPDERQANDAAVGAYLGYRLVLIPNRGTDGRLDPNEPSKLVKVDWHCPFCGVLMQEPQTKTYNENSITYLASVWDTACGCKVRYSDLKSLDGKMPLGYLKNRKDEEK